MHGTRTEAAPQPWRVVIVHARVVPVFLVHNLWCHMVMEASEVGTLWVCMEFGEPPVDSVVFARPGNVDDGVVLSLSPEAMH